MGIRWGESGNRSHGNGCDHPAYRERQRFAANESEDNRIEPPDQEKIPELIAGIVSGMSIVRIVKDNRQ
jgi:hypothetical protein